MKIKSDFITNSSSSSFIVAFKKFPESVDEMKKALFGNREEFQNPYDDNEAWSTDVIAAMVFAETVPATKDAIIEEMGYLSDLELLDSCRKSDGMTDWDEYNRVRLESATKKANEFLERVKGMDVAIYEYSDNDGSLGSSMEHGRLFKRLEHVWISKH